MIMKIFKSILVVLAIVSAAYLISFLFDSTFEESAMPILIGIVAALAVRSGK